MIACHLWGTESGAAVPYRGLGLQGRRRVHEVPRWGVYIIVHYRGRGVDATVGGHTTGGWGGRVLQVVRTRHSIV